MNGLRARMGLVTHRLKSRAPDLVELREPKPRDEEFPQEEMSERSATVRRSTARRRARYRALIDLGLTDLFRHRRREERKSERYCCVAVPLRRARPTMRSASAGSSSRSPTSASAAAEMAST